MWILATNRMEFQRQNSGKMLKIGIQREDRPATRDRSRCYKGVHDRHRYALASAGIAGFGGGFVVGRFERNIGEGSEKRLQFLELCGVLNARQ